MAKSKKIIKVDVWIEPATPFQKDFAEKVMRGMLEAFKATFEGTHQRNKVDLSIEEDTRFT